MRPKSGSAFAPTTRRRSARPTLPSTGQRRAGWRLPGYCSSSRRLLVASFAEGRRVGHSAGSDEWWADPIASTRHGRRYSRYQRGSRSGGSDALDGGFGNRPPPRRRDRCLGGLDPRSVHSADIGVFRHQATERIHGLVGEVLCCTAFIVGSVPVGYAALKAEERERLISRSSDAFMTYGDGLVLLLAGRRRPGHFLNELA